MTRLHVDWTRCDGHGSCAELLPELLVQDDWGFPLSRTGEPDPTVPRSLDGLARRAVKACPLQALRLRS
ncbi:MAG TPA: ferredoxin [Marmoricola sp.]